MRQTLLVELDYLVVNGRQLQFDAMKSVLKAHRVELTPPQFSRNCVGRNLKQMLTGALRAVDKQDEADGLLEPVRSEILKAYQDDTLAVDDGFVAIVKAAQESGAGLGGLTALGASLAGKLLERAGIAADSIVLQTTDLDSGRPCSCEHWLQLARKLETSPRCCLVACTQGSACHAALAARMCCLVRPDEFTAFQGFSGADYVVDTLDPEIVKEHFANQC